MRIKFAVCAAGLTALSMWVVGTLIVKRSWLQPAEYQRAVDGRTSQSEQGPRGAFVIHGTVVDAATGSPVERAEVHVYSEDNGVSRATTTDEQGQWKATELPAGSYAATVQKAEYQTTYSGFPGIPLTAAGPQRRLNLALRRGSALSGRITHSDGIPAVDVRVEMLRVVPGKDDQTLQFAGVLGNTDHTGRFRLRGVPDGEYVLAAHGAEFHGPPGMAGTTYYPGTTVAVEARRFRLSEGDSHKDLRFALFRMPVRRVRGRVVTSTGDPALAHVHYEVQTEGYSSSGWSGFSNEPSSDFSIERLTPGRYTLVATSESSDGIHEAGSIDVTVGDADIDGLVIKIAPLATIRGRVVTDGYESWSLDWIRVHAMSPDYRGTGGEAATVGRDRTFEIRTRHAPAQIVAIQPMFGWEVTSVRWQGRELKDGLLSIKTSEIVSGVDVVLRRRTSVIEGTVSNATDCTRVVVLQRRKDDTPACVALSTLRDGQFRTMPLPAGEYRIAATDASPATPLSPARLWDDARPLTLDDDKTVTLTLTARPRP
jgi:hypothetical protein